MTKQLCDSMLDDAAKGELFGWLYDNAETLTKDEALLIARELAHASAPTSDPNYVVSQREINDEFTQGIVDFYSTWGFDDEETYVAELGIYENGHIVNTIHINVSSREEAEEETKAMEKRFSERQPDSDWMVSIDDFYLQ